VRESVNPTDAGRIPEQHRRFLEELLAPDVQALRERFGLSWPLGPHPLVMRLPRAEQEIPLGPPLSKGAEGRDSQESIPIIAAKLRE